MKLSLIFFIAVLTLKFSPAFSQSIIVRDNDEAIQKIDELLQSTVFDTKDLTSLLKEEGIPSLRYSSIKCSDLEAQLSDKFFSLGGAFSFRFKDEYYLCLPETTALALTRDLENLREKNLNDEATYLLRAFIYHPIMQFWTLKTTPNQTKEITTSFEGIQSVIESIKEDSFFRSAEEYSFLSHIEPTTPEEVLRTYISLSSQTEESYYAKGKSFFENLEKLEARQKHIEVLKSFLSDLQERKLEKTKLRFRNLSEESTWSLNQTDKYLNETLEDIENQIKALEAMGEVFTDEEKSTIGLLQDKNLLTLKVRQYLTNNYSSMTTRLLAYEQSLGIEPPRITDRTNEITSPKSASPESASPESTSKPSEQVEERRPITISKDEPSVESSTKPATELAAESTAEPNTTTEAVPRMNRRPPSDEIEVKVFVPVPATTHAADISDSTISISAMSGMMYKCFSPSQCVEASIQTLEAYPDFVWGKTYNGFLIAHIKSSKALFLTEEALLIFLKERQCIEGLERWKVRGELARAHSARILTSTVGAIGETIANAVGFACHLINEDLVCTTPNDYEFTKEMWEISSYHIQDAKDHLSGAYIDRKYAETLGELFLQPLLAMSKSAYSPQGLQYALDLLSCGEVLGPEMYMKD